MYSNNYLDDFVTAIYRLCFTAMAVIIVGFVLFYILREFVTLLYRCHKAHLRIALPRNTSGIVLGKKFGFRIFSPVRSEEHTAVFGGSGSGKTVGPVIASLISWVKGGIDLLSRLFGEYCSNRGFFTIDISGDISANVPTTKSLVFEPLNTNTTPYNAFHYVDLLDDDNDIDDELTAIVDILLPLHADDEDGHWFDNKGHDILEACFFSFYRIGLDFWEICHRISSSSFEKLKDDIYAIDYEQGSIRLNQFEGSSEKNTNGALGSAKSAVKILSSPRLKAILRRNIPNEICVHARSIEEYNIFFKISDKEKDKYSSLAELVVGQLLEYLSGREAENYSRKLLIVLDEFASFPKINIKPLLEKYRKRKVRVMIVLQSLAQLDDNYGEKIRRIIIDNCRINILCEVTDTDSAEYFSKKIGNRREGGFLAKLLGGFISLQGQYTKERIYPPEDFAKLDKHAIILCWGRHFKLRKAFYFKEKAFRELEKESHDTKQHKELSVGDYINDGRDYNDFLVEE